MTQHYRLSFLRRSARLALVSSAVLGVALAAGRAIPARAVEPAVPVMEIADGDHDTCGYGVVRKLNPKGDNFLAVRAGPGTHFKMIDKLHSGDPVWLFDFNGDWIGIVYGAARISCSPVAKTKAYRGPGLTGWAHKKYIRLIAG